jgi:hypothetical protein
MYVLLPDAGGACAEGTRPLYRLRNQRNATGHRYVVDRALREALRAAGMGRRRLRNGRRGDVRAATALRGRAAGVQAFFSRGTRPSR